VDAVTGLAMRSLQLCRCGEPLEFAEIANPKPTGTEVFLKVLAAGVCHSDLHIWDGYYDLGGGKTLKLTDRGVKLPLTMGHENVGEVVAVGPQARGVKVGDKRLVFPWIGCGQCAVCKRGDDQLCMSPRFLGVFRDGGYSTHLMVPHPRYLVNYGKMRPEFAAPLACSGLTAYGALKKLGSLIKTEPVVIIGAGGLGLICISILKAMKGKGAIVVDIDLAKREAARHAGALTVIDGKAADVLDQVKAAAGGAVWGAIDFVGAGATTKMAFDSIAKGGKIIVVGLFGGDIAIPVPYLPMRAATLQGSYTGSLAELNELVKLVRRIPLPLVPTATTKLDNGQKVLDNLKANKVVGRVVLTPDK
jgi:D-arabinose 1-dehydrogenase-like Zn-dependent alcohol dehydrogenase